MHKELLKVVQDLKLLLAPKGAKRGIHTNPITPPLDQKNRSSIPPESKSLSSIPSSGEPVISPIKIRPLEPVDKKTSDKTVAKSIGLTLTDLVDWYQKKFKTSALSPLSDKRALDAKKRFVEGTEGAPLVVFFPKKGDKEELQLYKNIQMAIHHYLLDCQALFYDQFSQESAKKTRLILTDPNWVKPYQKQIIKDPETKMDSLWGVPIFYFEAYEKLKTPEGKERLWKALLSLPRS